MSILCQLTNKQTVNLIIHPATNHPHQTQNNETEKESSYDVKHCQVLGEGNFGKVWKAEVDDICGYEGTILVAVKGVKASRKNKQTKPQTCTKNTNTTFLCRRHGN